MKQPMKSGHRMKSDLFIIRKCLMKAGREGDGSTSLIYLRAHGYGGCGGFFRISALSES